MLALIGATTLVIVALILFGLWYVSQTMGTSAHRTAIESAALAAAGDLGRVAVFTPECGYVSLTGLAPVGPTTNAPDNWFRQVHGINELLASARVDMAIADELGDSKLRAFASNDVANILKAKDELTAALQAACVQGGSATDVYGNKITPYDDALNIYLANQAIKSSYVAGSFKLAMGNVSGGIATATVVPQISNVAKLNGRKFGNANVPANQQINGYYMSETNISLDGMDFVFGSVGRQAALADNHKFVTSIPGLPYQIPCAVQVTATQEFQDQGIKQQTKFTASATTGGSFKTPAPGAFTICFPDGPMSEFAKPGDLENSVMSATACKVKEAVNGDYPTEAATNGANMAEPPKDWSSPPDGSSAATIYRSTFYDWLRAGGSTVNVDSAVDMQSLPFASPSAATVVWASLDLLGTPYTLGPIPTGVMHIYEYNPDGSIQYRHKDVQPDPYLDVSMNQLYAENIQTINSATKTWEISIAILAKGGQLHTIEATNHYDFYARDLIHHHGMGKHDGEPCDSPTISALPPANRLAWKDDCGAGGCGADLQQITLAALNAITGGSGGPPPPGPSSGNGLPTDGLPPMLTDCEDFALTNTAPLPYFVVFKNGPPGGAPRPTYVTNGVASELRFRRQIDIHNLNTLLGHTGYIGLMTNPVAGAAQGTAIDTDTSTATTTSTTTTTTTSGP